MRQGLGEAYGESMYGLIENTFGVSDGLARGLAFAISLAVVLALFALFVLIIKRLTGVQSPTSRSRQPRLAVMDAANIDTRRKLILVRRDNVEHLILIGGTSDLVVEQGIVKGTPVSAAHSRQQHIVQPIAMDTATSESENIKAALGAKAPSPEDLETKERSPAHSKMRRDHDSAEPPLSAAVTKPVAALASRLSRRPAASAEHEAISSRTTNAERPGRDTDLSKERVATGAPGAESGLSPVQSARAAVLQRPRANGVSAVPTPAPRPIKDDGPQSASAQNNRDPAADLATTLSRSLRATTGMADQPATKRNVTPPSSGPAAQAHTAYPQRLSTLRQKPVVEATALQNMETAARSDITEASERTLDSTPAPEADNLDNKVSVFGGTSENNPSQPIDDTPTGSNVQPINGAKKNQNQVTLSAPGSDSGVDDPAIFGDSVTLEKPFVAPADKSNSDSTESATLTNGVATPSETANTAAADDANAQVKPETAADNPLEDEMASLLDEINGPAKK